MKLRKTLVVAAFTIGLTAVTARADRWAPPTPRLWASEWGAHALKVVPENGKLAGRATGTLFTLRQDGKERVLWRSRLVNMPVRAFVADRSPRVVTVDTYGNLGFAHSLVIYGTDGRLIRDYKLEDLLSAGELGKVHRTRSSRWWTNGATFGFSPDEKHFTITLAWGRAVTVHLPTGKLVQGKR